MSPPRRSRALTLTFLAVILLAVACAKKLSELEPYPCANDGSCPDGRACTPDMVCAPAKIDSICRAGETDCTTAAAGGRCALGVCGEPCDGTRLTCPEGRVCTVAMGAGGEGACVKPCEDAAGCPPHLTCRQLDVRDGKVVRACLSPTEKSSLGGTCKTKSDCTGQGSALECFAGVCSLPCKSQDECAPEFLCPSGGGGCLRDCTTDTAACDADQSCKPIWTAGRRGCTGKDADVPACDSVKGLAVCEGVCGQSVNSTVECSSARCPTGATCSSDPVCACDSAKACGPNGQKCTSASPCPGQWWCEPSLTNVGCNDDVTRIVAGCICKDGRRLVSPCVATKTCEARCRDECSIVAQDCSDPARSKCTSVIDAAEEHDKCVPMPATPKSEGEACTRSSSEATGWDDCGKGLFCSVSSAEPGKASEYRCRRFCLPQAPGCPDGQICALSRNTIDVLSELALCRPRCTFPDGTECGPGARCYSNGACFADLGGSKDLDAFCRDESECRSPLVCDSYRNRCVPSCEAGRSCPPGYTCRQGLGGEVTDAGGIDGGASSTSLPLCVKNGS